MESQNIFQVLVGERKKLNFHRRATKAPSPADESALGEEQEGSEEVKWD